MFKLIVPTHKQYDNNKVLPIRIRWRHKGIKKEINSGLFVSRADWDFKRQTYKTKADSNLKRQVIEIEEKAGAISESIKLGKADIRQIKELWNSGSLSIKSVDEFIQIHLSRLKDSTKTARINSLRAFKKHLKRDTKEPLVPQDITPLNCRIVRDNMVKDDKAQATINTCLKGIRATYNDMYRHGVEGISSELKLDRGLIKKERSVVQSILSFNDFENGISKAKTRLEWEAMAIGLLSFSLRGLDLIDIFKINKKHFHSTGELESLSQIVKNGMSGDQVITLIISRSKVPGSAAMHMSLSSGHAVYGLLELLKESITVSSPTLISSDPFALSSIATDYDFDTYRRFTQSRSKAFSKLTGKPFKYSRKTFRTKASVVANVSTEIGNALLGQENANISANYLSMEELAGHVNRAHSEVLEDFNVDALYFQLLKKTVISNFSRSNKK